MLLRFNSFNPFFEDQKALKLGSKDLHFFPIIFLGDELIEFSETSLFFECHDGYARPFCSSSGCHKPGTFFINSTGFPPLLPGVYTLPRTDLFPGLIEDTLVVASGDLFTSGWSQ